MMSQRKLKIIISGGGTGGHIFPAIACAQALEKKTNNAVEILFVGAKGRMEMEKVPLAGYPIRGLWISGLQRSLSLKNISFPFKVLHSLWTSFSILKSFKPDAVIGFGGYASSAIVYAAGLKKIPTLIHEQNSYAGITNKILKNSAKTICVAYEGMERFFPSDKIIMTGNPVRKGLSNSQLSKIEAIQSFGLNPERKTILVIGGSLGARTLNESLATHIELLNQSNVNWIWQCGKNFDVQSVAKAENIFLTPFIQEMNPAYSAADLVISRAGALSIAEIALCAKPVILVPSPNVAEDHQTKNAHALVVKNAAILIRDKDARNELIPAALALLNDTNKLHSLSENISHTAYPNAADQIADEVLKIIKSYEN